MNIKLPNFVNNPSAAVIAGIVAGLTNGIAVGYILGKKKSETPLLVDYEIREEKPHVDEIDVEEIDDPVVIPFERPGPLILSEEEAEKEGVVSKNHPSNDDFTPERPKNLAEALSRYTAENVFDTHPQTLGEWDYDVETKARGLRDPYVIHFDEYHSEESGCRQSALIYYAGDNVMCDEDDRVIQNYEDITGDLKWGHGSFDQDLVFVRNPRLEAEYEIVRSQDSYMHVILGVEAEEMAEAEEIRHSHRPGKFRLGE